MRGFRAFVYVIVYDCFHAFAGVSELLAIVILYLYLASCFFWLWVKSKRVYLFSLSLLFLLKIDVANGL